MRVRERGSGVTMACGTGTCTPGVCGRQYFLRKEIVHLESGDENGFLPLPSEEIQTDIIYICSPNNPTGAAYDRKKLREWVDYANRNATVLLYV